MRDLIIDMADFGGVASAGDEVVLSAPEVRGSSVDPGRLITPQPRTLELVDGVVTVPVEVGPLRVTLKPRGGVLPGTTFKTIVPEGEGPITLLECLEGQFQYDPPVVNRALETIKGAVAAELDTALGGRIEESIDHRARLSAQAGDQAVSNNEPAWAQVTESGHRLPLGYTSDGHLDPYARKIWREDVLDTHDVTLSEYAHVVTTEDSYLLLGIKRDGRVTIPGLETGSATFETTFERYRHTDDTFAPVNSDTTQIAGWGSSSMQGMTGDIVAALNGLPVTYTNYAQSGEFVEHNAARMGVEPAVIDPVTIPESGPVTVTTNTMPFNPSLKAYTGWLAGVHGTLAPYSGVLQFTRSEAGDSIVLSNPVEFTPDIDAKMFEHTQILQLGKNNLWENDAVNTVTNLTERIIRHLRPLHVRALALGHHWNRHWPVGHPIRERSAEIDAHMRAVVGESHFIDTHAITTGQEIWDRTGITPTPQDLADQEAGILPGSLASDNQHFTADMEVAMAQIIRERIDYLQWY